MDSVTILVLLLCAGVVALLIWFEINSRRNEARNTARSAGMQTSPKEIQIGAEPKRDKMKAA
jgi:flagellar biosynthesis/type III secretory pathway M-ring protein FliF/YscJ